jgi:aminoglycoside 3-N-acetyltransferase
MRRLTGFVPWRVRLLAGRIVGSVRRARWRMTTLDGAAIDAALAGFGPLPGDALMVHSSLKACGYFRGGAPTVVQALRRWVGDRTLAMPTHTYCYPDNAGHVPVFDIRQTPSVVGAITDHFWRQPGVARSLHPTHSLACAGPAADELCRGHESCETPAGKGTPYARLVERDCGVLMFGATLAGYTFFHTAENAAGAPYQYEAQPYALRVRDRDGVERAVVMRRQDIRSTPTRFAETAGWLEKLGLLRRRKLGLGELLFLPHARAVHERMVEEITRDPLFLVAESARTDVARRLRL